MADTATNPRVSVIMPAFNAAPYIAAALSSILAQTYATFELLVIDDGSTDSTVQVISRFTDPRLKLLRNENNLGLVASLTRGLSAAGGDLIARMDADDISLPRRIERLVHLINSDPGLSVVSCAYEDFNESHNSLSITVLPVTDSEIRRDLYCKSHVFCHAGSIIRKQALEDVGGYRAEWFPLEDRDLWLRMMARGRGANLTEVLYRVRKHTQSVVATRAEYQSQLILQSTINALQHPVFPANVPQHVQRLGWARGALFSAFGLAFDADQDGVVYFLQQALDWDAVAANQGFEELLMDRVDTYMHYHTSNVMGVQAGIERILTVLPSQLSSQKSLKAAALARAHAIAAFQASAAGDAWSARKHALAGFSKSRVLWSNRGLLKLVAGTGSKSLA